MLSASDLPPYSASANESEKIEAENDETLSESTEQQQPQQIPSKCRSWMMNPVSPYEYAIEQGDAFISPRDARTRTRVFLPTVLCALPACGTLVGWLVYSQIDDVEAKDVARYVFMPFAAATVCGCYWFSYCVIGRLDWKHRPSRSSACKWPWDFSCSLLGTIAIFIQFSWYGLIVPTLNDSFNEAFFIPHLVFVITTLALFTWIELADPSRACLPSPERDASLEHNQHCSKCSRRAQQGFTGPWSITEHRTGHKVVDCYYSQTRRRHCKRCNRCVVGFDHHCEFLNQCICDFNYKQYIAMMASFWLTLAFQFVVGVAFLINYHGDRDWASFHNTQDCIDLYGERLYIILVYSNQIFCLVMLLFVSDLLRIHTKLLCCAPVSHQAGHRYSTLDLIRDSIPPEWKGRQSDIEEWIYAYSYHDQVWPPCPEDTDANNLGLQAEGLFFRQDTEYSKMGFCKAFWTRRRRCLGCVEIDSVKHESLCAQDTPVNKSLGDSRRSITAAGAEAAQINSNPLASPAAAAAENNAPASDVAPAPQPTPPVYQQHTQELEQPASVTVTPQPTLEDINLRVLVPEMHVIER